MYLQNNAVLILYQLFDFNFQKEELESLPLVVDMNIYENNGIVLIKGERKLAFEAQSNVNLRYKNYNLEIDGGTAYWNGKNLANNNVSSGVYVVLFSDFDTFETKVSKIMIVR